jgi:hypothetical protein
LARLSPNGTKAGRREASPEGACRVECRRAAIGHPKVLPGQLGPAEGVWANMKNGLGNVAARDVTQLAAVVKNHLKNIQYRPELIGGFLAQTGLTLAPHPRNQTTFCRPPGHRH